MEQSRLVAVGHLTDEKSLQDSADFHSSTTAPYSGRTSEEHSEPSNDIRITSASGAIVSSPVQDSTPDGGWIAWSQVIAGHLVAFNSWGYINSFGLFQAYYTTSLKQASSAISWVGSIQIFLTLFIGAISGRAMDAGHYRVVAVAGLSLQVLGIFMTSFIGEYWQLLLAQGICQSLGNGLVFTPTIALVSSYFRKNRAIAISGMTSGTATGGIIFPIVARQLSQIYESMQYIKLSYGGSM